MGSSLVRNLHLSDLQFKDKIHVFAEMHKRKPWKVEHLKARPEMKIVLLVFPPKLVENQY